MGNFLSDFRKKLVLTTALVGITAFAGAGDVSPQDNRNGFEKTVHETTRMVDTGLHAITETALYPIRLTSYALSEVGRLGARGINYIGEKTGAENIAHLVGKGISAPLNLSSKLVDDVTDLAQNIVEAPVALTGSMLDATATATRNVNEAGRKLGKETLLQGSGLISNIGFTSGSMVDSTILTGVGLARSVFTDTAGTVADVIGLVDKEKGQELQDKVDITDGALIAGQVATSVAGFFLNPLDQIGVGAAVMPLLNEDIRNATISEETTKDTIKMIKNTVDTVKQAQITSVKDLLKEMNTCVKKAEKGAMNTPGVLPSYNPLTGGNRSSVKQAVDETEKVRIAIAKKMENSK